MSTITDLAQPLHLWIRRLRMQRALTWSLRGLIVGLISALALGSLGLYQAKLLRDEFLLLVLSISLMAPIIFGLTSYFWRIQPLQAARRFDILFHLGERVSTALELERHPEHIPPEILSRQLDDAVTSARAVNPSRDFPFRLQRREGLVALLCIALISLVWLRGEAWFNASQQARAVQHAVEEQAAQIEEIVKQIEANETLTEEQKQALTQPLQEALQSLQNNPTLESSVSTLTSASEKMQALSDSQARQMSEALQQAGSQLANQEGSPLQSAGQQLAQGNNTNAASELANIDVSQLSASEQQQLADQLDALANSLQSSNPQLANQLNQAAQALQNGDAQAAQQALNQAAQSLAQAGQQIASSQIASQTASQLQQGAGQVMAAGGGQGQQQANQGGQGQGQGNQSGQGQGQGQGSSQSNAGNNGSGSGAGRGTGSSPGGGSEAGTDPIAQNNGPGDGGVSSYEQIYAPQLLGGEGGPQVNIPPSDQPGGDVIGQGPLTPGDPGSSTVPYNEVYSQYEQINNQAIENSDIPPSFIQIIKNYFDSLKP